jgi:hypothetical protein
MVALRRPAPADFLARRRAATDWTAWRLTPPAEGSRRWLVETCRAELEWAEAEWRRLDGDGACSHAPGLLRHGPHPAEALRLPHEHAAARLVNCHVHLDLERWAIDDLRRRLRRQREAASDAAQDDAWRVQWAVRAEASVQALRACRDRRAIAWRAFRAAAVRYRALRATIDADAWPRVERAAA